MFNRAPFITLFAAGMLFSALAQAHPKLVSESPRLLWRPFRLSQAAMA